MERQLIIIKKNKLLFKETAFHIEKTIKDTLIKKNLFTIALSGGNTPKNLFKMLSEPPFNKSIEWDKIHLFQVDERCVEVNNA